MRIAAILLIATLGACASDGDATALCTRAAEAIDPRLPVGGALDEGALTARGEAQAILDRLNPAIDAFEARAPAVAAAVDRAGAPGSESWVAALEQVAILDDLREPVALGVGDLAALVTDRIADGAWSTPADRQWVEGRLDGVSAVDRRQAELLEELTRRLGS